MKKLLSLLMSGLLFLNSSVVLAESSITDESKTLPTISSNLAFENIQIQDSDKVLIKIDSENSSNFNFKTKSGSVLKTWDTNSASFSYSFSENVENLTNSFNISNNSLKEQTLVFKFSEIYGKGSIDDLIIFSGGEGSATSSLSGESDSIEVVLGGNDGNSSEKNKKQIKIAVNLSKLNSKLNDILKNNENNNIPLFKLSISLKDANS